MSVDYSMLPEHMREGARLYVEHGIEPGSFMEAVLIDSLVQSFSRADAINIECMREWAQWLYTECPATAWGDARRFDAWIACGGIKGRNGRTMTAEEREQFELRR